MHWIYDKAFTLNSDQPYVVNSQRRAKYIEMKIPIYKNIEFYDVNATDIARNAIYLQMCCDNANYMTVQEVRCAVHFDDLA